MFFKRKKKKFELPLEENQSKMLLFTSEFYATKETFEDGKIAVINVTFEPFGVEVFDKKIKINGVNYIREEINEWVRESK